MFLLSFLFFGIFDPTRCSIHNPDEENVSTNIINKNDIAIKKCGSFDP